MRGDELAGLEAAQILGQLRRGRVARRAVARHRLASTIASKLGRRVRRRLAHRLRRPRDHRLEDLDDDDSPL